MEGIDFGKEFSPDEMAALSSIAGQMGAGKVVAMQKLAGQMSAVEGAGFDAKGMMGALDNNGIGITATTGLSKTVFQIPSNLSPGNTIQVSSAGNYAVENGKTSAEQVATALREHLNSDSTFSKNRL